jgi:hypothetical protein
MENNKSKELKVFSELVFVSCIFVGGAIGMGIGFLELAY